MIESAQHDVEDIRKLLITPTPESFEIVNQRLAQLASSLEQIKAELSAGKPPDSKVTEFLGGLPAEMARVLTLMQAPVTFLIGLNVFLAAKFGSYDQTGNVKNLGASARTLAHL